MPTTGEVSLYFHIPFCKKKCHYCHFYTIRDTDSDQKLLHESLLLEMERIFPLIKDKKIVSIYFGGGTPSLFPPSYFEEILTKLSKLDLCDCEITIEANPDDLTSSLLNSLALLGFNRLSMGVQSFDNLLLEFLGRAHDNSQIFSAFKSIEQSQFTNISIDLMYDIPKQSFHSWTKTLQALKKAPITHLSLYNLTIEPNTLFHRKRFQFTPHLPDQDLSLSMLESAIEHFEKLGLNRYEISAFSKPGFFSKHNTGYWVGRPFLGLGPSAFSFWECSRFRNTPSLPKYAKALKEGKNPIDYREKLSDEALRKEAFCIHLRLIDGLDLEIFQKKWGSLSSEEQSTLNKLISLNLVDQSSNRVKLSEKGLLFYDSVAAEII